MFDDCIIMAGGSGTRLWPASNSRMPKQFLPITGTAAGETGCFFNTAVERALSVIDMNSDGRIIIIAGRSHVTHIVKACEKYPASWLRHMVLIPEPEGKNTAPAIACAVNYCDWMSGAERNMLVLTSDHIISPLESFRADAFAAEAFAKADKLAVFGIKPSWPETGYGYIETGKLLSAKAEQPEVYAVKSFREKPDTDKAREFLKAGSFFWNLGMFAFSSKFILRQFQRSAPAVLGPFGKLRAPDERSFRIERGLRILWEWLDLPEAYTDAEAISFDYAIAEKCADTVMVSAGFKWTDIGSWDEYAAVAGTGTTEIFETGAANCYVDSDIPVALIGVEDLIITVRSGKNGGPSAVLVAKKGETQKVREIVAQIKARGRSGLL